MQRVRVGLTGLASVLVLIGLASAIFSSVNREAPVNAIGAAKPDVVANMSDGPASNLTDPAQIRSEPLAELGVAPSTAGAATGPLPDNGSAPAAAAQTDSTSQN